MPFGFHITPRRFSLSLILALLPFFLSFSLSLSLFFARILNLPRILSPLRIVLKQKKKLQNIYGVCGVSIYMCNIYICVYIYIDVYNIDFYGKSGSLINF